jgi:hypothetical protein
MSTDQLAQTQETPWLIRDAARDGAAAVHHALPGFINGCCRREPDLESIV